MRKTFNIKWLIEHVNGFNASSADQYKAEREGKNMMLEMILHQAGCYNGFGYLEERELLNDAMSVGVREQKEDGSWNFDDTDHTRIYYYIERGL